MTEQKEYEAITLYELLKGLPSYDKNGENVDTARKKFGRLMSKVGGNAKMKNEDGNILFARHEAEFFRHLITGPNGKYLDSWIQDKYPAKTLPESLALATAFTKRMYAITANVNEKEDREWMEAMTRIISRAEIFEFTINAGQILSSIIAKIAESTEDYDELVAKYYNLQDALEDMKF
ncbi:MAG: hypothetical protein FD169_1838 [Bacillota bacterium]|nr:MAG: hypothetical protein FD169_1838 [Bacillota bacterium]